MAVVDDKLRILLDRIVPALQPEAVYLFGSRARGDFDEDSDYDLLVILPDDRAETRPAVRRAYEAKAGTGIPADFLACTRGGFERSKDLKGTLSYEASHFGVLVYGR
ncbi:nucleotidyltransferase domain-containing protein [Azospirillum thermophilum]|uniref:Nucleotidyltransferase domain-containing protein n=1 Tax=Azospirillum thermophilum TaxID=2202148 RepID=A0A2S2CQK1_9PROT|nr:nucleotidyltransferase domain-containing protein [Azospirillum thermophilum]AWK86640.1 nucleotidyltransferase domain-containing protein [Azospirillum thermophilum]